MLVTPRYNANDFTADQTMRMFDIASAFIAGIICALVLVGVAHHYYARCPITKELCAVDSHGDVYCENHCYTNDNE